MGAIQKLHDASYAEIEAGGFVWRVALRRGTDLMEHGGASLLMGLANAAQEQAEGIERPKQGLSEKQLVDQQRYAEILVCSAVVAVREVGSTEWESCRLTRARNEEDPDSGVAHISALPFQVITTLSAEIIAQCVKPIQDKIRPFRDDGDSACAGQDSEAV